MLDSATSMASTKLNTHPCSYCRRIVVHQGTVIPRNYVRRQITFHFSLFDIKEAATQHCLFCEWILEEYTSVPFQEEKLYSPQDLFLRAEIKIDASAMNSIAGFSLWSRTDARIVTEFASNDYSICAAPGMSTWAAHLSPFSLSLRAHVD
jgi:hypothetical protein